MECIVFLSYSASNSLLSLPTIFFYLLLLAPGDGIGIHLLVYPLTLKFRRLGDSSTKGKKGGKLYSNCITL